MYEPRIEAFEAIVSPDMKWLIYRTAPGAEMPRDILAVSLVGERNNDEIETEAWMMSQAIIS